MNMQYKTVIVTGGSGFIGSHLVDRLVEVSKRVVVIDKVKPSKLNKNKKAVYKKVDIRDEDVINVFKKEQPDALFHLAAHLLDRVSMREPVENAQHNVIGSLNVFEGMRRFGATGGKIMFTSSGAVYGNQRDLPISEKAKTDPETPYGITKFVAEQYLRFYHRHYGIPYTALRLGNAFGPRQDSSVESGAISIFTSRLLRGEPVTINNDGLTTRDYVYVQDVVDAHLAAAQTSVIGAVNVGTGVATSTSELFACVREAVGVQSVPERDERAVDLIKHISLDTTRARQEMGWSAQVGFEEGLAKTVAWYREHV